MSNQSNNKFNISRDRSFYGLSNAEGNTTKDTFLKNGSKILLRNYSNISLPNSSLVGGGGNDNFNPYVIDSRIKDLESKLATLEQANKILIERINTNEKSFSVQLNQLQANNLEERENRYKTEKVMNIISEQNNVNSNDLNMKINMLQERIVKGDENKTQQRQFDLESQKYLIGKLTEKITKTVKSEVEARYKADMDGKIFSQKISNKFESSLDILKKEIEEITNQTRVEIQNISRECSERTHNVSKYIDQQIQEAVSGKGSSNEELKNFVRKLTEQVKNSLISITKKNEMIENRLNNLENKDDINKKYYHDFMSTVEQRLIKKINDVKIFTEINMKKHDQYLEQSMKEMIYKIEKNIQFIAGQLIDTRIKINERFETIFEEHHNQYHRLVEDMEEICNRIYKYEDLIKEYEDKFKDINEKVDKSLANIYVREDVQIIQERIIKTIECNFLQEQINNIYNALQKYNIQFKENINELNKGTQNSFEFMNTQLKEQERRMFEIAEKNLNMFEELQKGSDAIEVNQMVNEMVAKVDNLLVTESLQKSKNIEYEIMKTIEEHKNNIISSFNEISNNKDNISLLQNKVSNIQHSLDISEKNMSEMGEQMKKMREETKEKMEKMKEEAKEKMENIREEAKEKMENIREEAKEKMEIMREEAKELEMKESVDKILNLMITNIDNALTKEKMDKMSQFDLDKMRKTIIYLEDNYNSLSNTNTEIDSIKSNIKQLNEQQDILVNKSKKKDDIKIATIQMLNNVEFDNIYSILKKRNKGNSKTEVNEKVYNEIVDNKINKAMEKIKNDNENMLIKCVQIKDKVTDPEQIRKILNDSSPIIYPNDQQDSGHDINSKKSSKKVNKKDETINNNNNNANINEEKKSKASNKSKNKTRKVSKSNSNEKKSSKNGQESNQSKGNLKSGGSGEYEDEEEEEEEDDDENEENNQ